MRLKLSPTAAVSLADDDFTVVSTRPRRGEPN